MDTTFAIWLHQELKARGLGARDLARMMKVPPASVYRILNEQRGVGRTLSKKIADALGVKSSVVLFHAGIADEDPSDPTQKIDSISRDILIMLEHRTMAEKRAAKATLEAFFENMDSHRGGSHHGRDRSITTGQNPK